VKLNSEKDVADIQTLMEEVDMRIAETKKDTFEFKRDIIIGAENTRTGKTCAEKMLRCAGLIKAYIQMYRISADRGMAQSMGSKAQQGSGGKSLWFNSLWQQHGQGHLQQQQ
jgi:hypothetical protein